MSNVNFPTNNSQKIAGLWATDHTLADEGSFFTACSPTPLTAITGTASLVADGTGGAQINPFILITNSGNAANANAKTIYPRYMKIKCGTGATFTSATDYCYSIRVDGIGSKWTSGGSVITPANVNTNTSVLSQAVVRAGALVTLAMDAATGRLLCTGQIQGSIPVAKDVWYFTFGDTAMPSNVLGATGLKALTIPCGPIALGPGYNLALDLFGTANGGTFAAEFEIGYAERVSGL